MNTYRQTNKTGRNGALSILTAAVLALGLLLGLPAPDGSAYALPEDGAILPEGASGLALDTPCSLTLSFQSELGWDLDEAETAVDLYRIADAVRVPGYDVYAYCVDDTSPYYSLIRAFVEENDNWVSQTMHSDPAGNGAAGDSLVFYYAPADPESAPVRDRTELVDRLSEALFGSDPLVQETAPGSQAPEPGDGGDATPGESQTPAPGDGSPQRPFRTTIGSGITGLPAGLYLSVVHGQDIQSTGTGRPPYAVRRPVEAANPNGDSHICTVAYSDTRLYIFQPQLISLPGLVQTDGTAVTDTTAPGANWVSSVQAFTKGESEPRYASLAIRKTINSFAQPVSFVFRVRATDPNAQDAVVYEKLVTLHFDSATTQVSDTIFEGIPVGSDVTVTEEYAGSYTLTGASVSVSSPQEAYDEVVTDLAARSILIRGIKGGDIHIGLPPTDDVQNDSVILQTGELVTAAFTNSAGSTGGGGGSVINSFEPDAGDWNWYKTWYNPETGAWESTAPESVNGTAGEEE